MQTKWNNVVSTQRLYKEDLLHEAAFFQIKFARDQDYNWWWRSFFTSASSALYVFGYSCQILWLAFHPLAAFHLADLRPVLLHPDAAGSQKNDKEAKRMTQKPKAFWLLSRLKLRIGHYVGALLYFGYMPLRLHSNRAILVSQNRIENLRFSVPLVIQGLWFHTHLRWSLVQLGHLSSDLIRLAWQLLRLAGTDKSRPKLPKLR